MAAPARLLATLAVGFTIARCGGARGSLDQADRWLRLGRNADALARYRELAAEPDPRVRTLALVGAARASARLHDLPGARRCLRRAVDGPAVAGASEEAWFEYAELLRSDGDRAGALAAYRRAAEGAERHRGRAFPYPQAVRAIAELNAGRD